VFVEGDMVLVFMRKDILSARSYNKWRPKKYSPYKILKKIDNNVYVDLPDHM